MVKALKDLCLSCVMNNLEKFPKLQSQLPSKYKELLIERLADHDLFTPHYVPHIINNIFSANLRTIVLYECQQITDDILIKLSRSQCKLEVLKIHGCHSLTDSGIEAITTNQDELESLELRRLTKISSNSLRKIKSEKLWRVDLKGCSSIKTEGIDILTKNNRNIKVLILGNKTGVDISVYQHVAENLQHSLEEFNAYLHATTSECLYHLSEYCSNLKKLNLEGCTLIDKDGLIKLFQGCTKLVDLDLSYCNKLRDYPDNEAFWILPQGLTDLTLCGVMLENETIFVECLQRLPKLRSIHLCGVTALNDNTLTQILEKIGKDLTTLDVSGYGGFTKNLTDAGIKSVSKYCYSLQNLKISLLADVTCITLLPLLKDRQRACQIQKLSINCKLTTLDVLYQVARSCENLLKYDLGGVSGVTNDIIFLLVTTCTKLTHISLKGCRLITDCALIELARCCPLKSLVLSGINNLTDASIFALANSCHQLEEIYLNGCSHVSSVAVHYLIDCCIKRLYVQHATPNAQPYQLMAKNLDTGEFCRADLLQVS
ncbi:hypothetical protein LOTGIDRAFT_238569 [Lottia gigantea]|uniref:F-box domain-containing protein n=1 Tax=Lottia gigantea TaxID=225164 RepID=V4CEL9_LOTGI|nr:hypothetical protein LOTGIDRAFT_238569 [Lottia gigantea]ESP00400.1 hypothetical protein LOTGIDRAFT_238569 [Lottia gigantea]